MIKEDGETDQYHIDTEIRRLEELTGLSLSDNILTLGYENHKLVEDAGMTDVMQVRRWTKTEFYYIVNGMVRLLETMNRRRDKKK